MSGIAVAIGGTAVIGAISSSSAARKSSAAASEAAAASKKAAKLQYQVSMAQLDFAKQQYNEWQGIFGPIEQNLSSYYKNLSSDTFAALGIQNIEQEYTRSREQLDTAMAKRGITDSGANAAGLTELENSRMLGRAQARAQAPTQVANQQLGFLSIGLGQQAQLQNGINNAYSNQINTLGQQATNSMNQSNMYSQQAAAGYAGVGNAIGQGINTYMTANAYQSQSNLNNAMANNLGNSTNYSTSPSSYGATSSWWQ